ncbi:hypothetical protein KKG45_04950 [bacterium]|nr:hypothetical protein [bacterium]MBU1072576.1 hypothetical protein [bacterium]MBU1674963.1 hypothetical protein [bacterium]
MKDLTVTKVLILLALLAGGIVLGTGCSEEIAAPGQHQSPDGPQADGGGKSPVAIGVPDRVHLIRRPFNPIDFGDGTRATSTVSNSGIATELIDISSGALLAELIWTYADQSLFIDVPGVTSLSADGADSATPFGCNVGLYYVYVNATAAMDDGLVLPGGDKDNPGCDGIPDILETDCMLACCEIHDQCYADNNCTARSWLPGHGQGAACTQCNIDVVICMIKCLPWWVPDWIFEHLIEPLLIETH